MKVPAGGGTPTPTTSTAAADVTHRNPWFLPDGRHFLFTVRGSASAPFGSIAVGSLDGGAATTLLERGSNPQYADGHLFTVIDGNLVAQRFDAAKQSLLGQASPLADGVEFYNPRDLGQYSVSGAGLVVYRRHRLRQTQLVWLDRSGKEVATVGEPSYYGALQLGADGRTLAAVRSDAAGANADVWILDLQRAQVTRATFASAPSDLTAALSPDGARLAVSASSVGGWAGATLWIQPVSGSGSRQSLLEKVSFSVTGWSPDQAFLVGDTQEAGSGFDVAYVAVADPSKVVHVTNSRFNERDAALSPDGRFVAYQSDETGRARSSSPTSRKPSASGRCPARVAELPTWRGDGRELYFVDAEGAVAVSVAARGDALELGTPERLPFSREAFGFASSTGGGSVGTAVRSPDGKRFLVARYDSEAVTEPVRLVRSWRRLVEE